MRIFHGYRVSVKTGLSLLAMSFIVAGCEELGASPGETPSGAQAQARGTSIEKDVERPDVFAVTENALWDGRPSLGGVWVAYPANTDPERVIIRNGANGKSVIGALFRRERDNPGPRIQLSSDAAVALGVIAGAPTEISIVVLRRETVEIAAPAAPDNPAAADPDMTPPARRGAQAAPVAVVAPPAAAPRVAPAAAAATGAGIAAIVEQTLSDVPAATAAPVSRLRKPYIQVAVFPDEEGAKEGVELLGNEGVLAEIQANDTDAPTLYRVISGPIMSRAERAARLRIIKGLGYTDAFYFK